jgi:hypothetical protein
MYVLTTTGSRHLLYFHPPGPPPGGRGTPTMLLTGILAFCLLFLPLLAEHRRKTKFGQTSGGALNR